MASQVHPIPYFTPSIFYFPQNVTLACPKMNLAHFQSHQNLPPLWVHCITIYHFHEAKILEAVLELRPVCFFTFPYTLIFSLKSYQSLLTFLKYSPSSISAICPGWTSDSDYKPGSNPSPSSVSAFKSFLMRILKHKPHHCHKTN